MSTNMDLLAQFVDTALVQADTDELIHDVYIDGGEEPARELMDEFNTAIGFVNTQLDQNYRFISEDQFQRYIKQ